MRNIGYARVSTTLQNLYRQIIALQEAGCEVIYQEKLSGTNTDRAELQKMLSDLQEGDVVIVKELTRVSRSTTDMLHLVQQITDRGANIKSLNEGWLDTTTPSGKLLLTIFAGLAQFENEIRSQRCQEGREIAMEKGTQFGRPKKNTKQLDFALKLVAEKQLSIRKICESTGVSKATLSRRIAEIKLSEGVI